MAYCARTVTGQQRGKLKKSPKHDQFSVLPFQNAFVKPFSKLCANVAQSGSRTEKVAEQGAIPAQTRGWYTLGQDR